MDPWDPTNEIKRLTTVDVDPTFEGYRGVLRQEAQEWAGLDVDPTAELFVFVGRWSKQKGIDLIADVFPSFLDRHERVQLICVGPPVDLYGKFAALKLSEIRKKYPGRVYSKPEYTAVPPFVFTGAEFALIPSRDEPFGLVAVEFGRKGALGVGARVGGLGSLPGWWYTVEANTTKHLHYQFKRSIQDALASETNVRAMMRAQSARQRFPVAKWVEDLSEIHRAVRKVSSGGRQPRFGLHSFLQSCFHPAASAATGSSSTSLTAQSQNRDTSNATQPSLDKSLGFSDKPTIRVRAKTLLSAIPPPRPGLVPFPALSFDGATGDRKDFSLQKSNLTFKDVNEKYYRAYQEMLHKLNVKTSEGDLCIEKYLVESETDWNKRLRDAKLDRCKDSTPNGSIYAEGRGSSLANFLFGWPATAASETSNSSHEPVSPSSTLVDEIDGFSLGGDHECDSFLKRWMLMKIGGWPIYSLLLVLGQIIAANSYQITLLTGSLVDSQDDTTEMLYILGGIYAATSVVWWLVFRSFKSIYALSLPFFFYGLAFLFVGISASLRSDVRRDSMTKVATGLYVTASSSGSLFAALNFGDEGKSLAAKMT
jgi:alpha-1,3-glucan synthase